MQTQREFVRMQIENELCRRSLFDFVKTTHHDFQSNWFHRNLCDELENFVQDVEDGKAPQLMIFAPPRHGKTELASRRFPAWLFGRNPELQFIACSYAADLASRNNRDVQRIIESDRYAQVFPGTRLNGKNAAAIGTPLKNGDIFEIVGHRGAYRSAGVGGGITGMGFDIGLIDDPLKNSEEANSATVRNSIFEWYQTTFLTRRSPRSGIIIIMTRWHTDDLCGRLLQQERDKWRVLSYPAIAESDDAYRRIGESLDPVRYPIAFLNQAKESMGSRNFSALYQQSPVVVGGQIIKTEWFKQYTQDPLFEFRFITADTAQKTKEANDFSVLACWGVSGRKLYLIDLLRGKWEAPELRKRAQAFWDKHKVNRDGLGCLRSVLVEDKASGTGLIQEWRSLGGIPVKAVQRSIDKYTRCLDVIGQIEAGNVYVPAGAPFVSDFLTECEQFSANDSHSFDDQVDVLIDAINEGLANYTNWGTVGRDVERSGQEAISAGADW